MKKSLVALAALAAVGAASAQSSVTLFGVVDAAVSYYESKTTAPNGQSQKQSKWALSSGNESSSRIGVRGVEDLGGGLAASFWAEGSLDASTGNLGNSGATSVFDRRTTGSLSGPFGELRLGRDYAPTFWNDTIFDPFGTVGVGANALWMVGHQSLNTAGNPDYKFDYTRNSNSIGYFLPKNLGGLYGQVQYGFDEYVKITNGNVTDNSRAGRYGGGRIGYANGPLDVAFAYGRKILPGTGTTENYTDTMNLGASYDFKVVKVMGEYGQIKFKDRTANLANKVQGGLIGVTAPVGPGLIKASYAHVQGDWNAANTSKPKIDKFALGYVHNLSKRTALYATFAYTKGKNGAGINAAGASGLGGRLNGGFDTTTGKGYGYDFGLRHSF